MASRKGFGVWNRVRGREARLDAVATIVDNECGRGEARAVAGGLGSARHGDLTQGRSSWFVSQEPVKNKHRGRVIPDCSGEVVDLLTVVESNVNLEFVLRFK